MVDREARDKMIAALESYMDEGTTAFEFDEELEQILVATNDSTVTDVGFRLWGTYDDLHDHRAYKKKELWDYYSRLLLLLRSNGEIEWSLMVRWCTGRRVLVIAAALGSVSLALFSFSGWGFLLAWSCCFALSRYLVFADSREHWDPAEPDLTIAPFPSFASLMALRRMDPSFRKRLYPHGVAETRKRAEPEGKFDPPLLRIGWFIVCPIVLIWKMLPDRAWEARIKVPA